MRTSIIIPAYNEEDNIPILVEKLKETITIHKLDWEIIIVDDGSTDKTYCKILECQKICNVLKVVHHKRRRGITSALLSGFKSANGDAFVYFPADLQYIPEDILKLTEKLEEGYDIITGWKTGKYEKIFVSKVYNLLSRMLFRVPVHDLNSIKAFRKEVIDEIPWRKDWHRYMVVMAWEEGFSIDEVKVKVYPRKYGKSKCGGLGRIIIGIFDLIAVKFQVSFMRKPMLFFGSIGGILLLAALIVGIIAIYLRFCLEHGYRPLGFLIIFLGLSGLVLFVVGFLAEAIAGIRDEINRLKRK